MKGPGYKVTGDVRRKWRCSQCGAERKLPGDITAFRCSCHAQPWMDLVVDIVNVPRPIQRPSDVERRPIDFGIEPPPPAPPKPEATIIKSAIQIEVETTTEMTPAIINPVESKPSFEQTNDESGDEWGEGIL